MAYSLCMHGSPHYNSHQFLLPQVCTSEVKCFCHMDFTGPDCSITKNRTSPPPLTTPVPVLADSTTPYTMPNVTSMPKYGISGKTTEVESVPVVKGKKLMLGCMYL